LQLDHEDSTCKARIGGARVYPPSQPGFSTAELAAAQSRCGVMVGRNQIITIFCSFFAPWQERTRCAEGVTKERGMVSARDGSF